MQHCALLALQNGLARSSYSLASAANAYRALQLTRQLATQRLHPFETVRPGTELFVHNMVGNKPHWLTKMLASALPTKRHLRKSGAVQPRAL